MRRRQFGEALVQHDRRCLGGLQAPGENVGEGVFKGGLIENARMNQAAEDRLLGNHRDRRLADALPERIMDSQMGEGLSHEALLPGRPRKGWCGPITTARLTLALNDAELKASNPARRFDGISPAAGTARR